MDTLSYLLDGRSDLAVLVGLVNYLSFFLMDLVILFITTDLCARIASVERASTAGTEIRCFCCAPLTWFF